jgi:hypothetical protein
LGDASGVRRPPPGVSGVTNSPERPKPIRTALAGFVRLSKRVSDRRSGSWVRRSLRVACATSRCSVDRPCPDPKIRTASAGLDALSGPPPCRPSARSGRGPKTRPPDRTAPPGVSCPSSALDKGVRCSRVCLTRHVPSSGFLTPSTVCSPPAPRPRGPLSLLGFRSVLTPCAVDRFVRRVATPREPGLRCASSPSSEEQEVECSAAVVRLPEGPWISRAEAWGHRRFVDLPGRLQDGYEGPGPKSLASTVTAFPGAGASSLTRVGRSGPAALRRP